MAVTPNKVPFKLFKWSVVLIAFFAILAWLLLLGGISALENVCNGACRARYGLPWFIIWFQFVLIFPAFFVEFYDLAAWRPTLMLLLAINTVLAIIECDNFLDMKDDMGGGSRINATIAGFIILSIFNLLLILLSGSRTALESRFGEDRDVGVATYPSKSKAPSNPGGPTSPQVTVPPPQSTYGTSAPSTTPATAV